MSTYQNVKFMKGNPFYSLAMIMTRKRTKLEEDVRYIMVFQKILKTKENYNDGKKNKIL